jgi:hypothetical protein
MRLIDADQLIKELKMNIVEVRNPEILEGILLAIERIKDQPTAEPQCIATVKVDFSKGDVEKLVKQYVKESIEISFNIGRLKELLMEYSYVKNKMFKYGGSKAIDGKLLDEETIDDIIRFIKGVSVRDTYACNK